jgi:hypothetical protein
MRLVLAGASLQCIRPFECTRSGNLQSHRSFACDPIIKTRQSPGRSDSTCSTIATTSRCRSASPV